MFCSSPIDVPLQRLILHRTAYVTMEDPLAYQLTREESRRVLAQALDEVERLRGEVARLSLRMVA